MLMRQLFDPETTTYSHPLTDEETLEAVLIDPVLEQVELDLQIVRERGLALRRARDATLTAPRLLLPSVQVHVNVGALPRAAANGVRHLRLPLNLFHPTDDLGNPRPA
jgi:hypothetical protein